MDKRSSSSHQVIEKAIALLACTTILACTTGYSNAQSKARSGKPVAAKGPQVDTSTPVEFPQRRAGLWEIKTSGAHSAGLGPAMFCVGDTTDTAKEHLDRTHGDKGACKIGPFRRLGDAWVSESICREGKTMVSSRSVVSGELSSDYRIDTEIQYITGTNTRREDREVLAARFINPCPSNMRVGDLMIVGMGKINMNDGTVVVPKTPRPRARKARS